MTRKRKPYKTCTMEFKLEALRLMLQSECPFSEIAMQLGIRHNQLYDPHSVRGHLLTLPDPLSFL